MKAFKKIKEKIESSLSGSKFRQINEELYNQDSSYAVEMLRASRELFQQYHEGYQHMTERWPVHPLDIIIKLLRTTGLKSNAVIRNRGFRVWDSKVGCGIGR